MTGGARSRKQSSDGTTWTRSNLRTGPSRIGLLPPLKAWGAPEGAKNQHDESYEDSPGDYGTERTDVVGRDPQRQEEVIQAIREADGHYCEYQQGRSDYDYPRRDGRFVS